MAQSDIYQLAGDFFCSAWLTESFSILHHSLDNHLCRLITRKQLEELLPGGSDPAIYLERLVSARVLRCRLAGSADETWQLYHDYLADAIGALDRRRRKYSLLLEEAQERYRLAEGLRKWSSLLTPQTQIRLLWRRWSEPDFRFAPHAGFVRLSLVRLVVNVWTLAAVAVAGWGLFWSEGREAEEDFQGVPTGRQPGAGIRGALAASQLPVRGYVRRGVFQDLLSTNTGRSRLAHQTAARRWPLWVRESLLLTICGDCLSKRVPIPSERRTVWPA